MEKGSRDRATRARSLAPETIVSCSNSFAYSPHVISCIDISHKAYHLFNKFLLRTSKTLGCMYTEFSFFYTCVYASFYCHIFANSIIHHSCNGIECLTHVMWFAFSDRSHYYTTNHSFFTPKCQLCSVTWIISYIVSYFMALLSFNNVHLDFFVFGKYCAIWRIVLYQ